MSTELVTGKVWPAIHAAAEQARGRKRAAVAFIGKDGAELLEDFVEGDLLVCNMGPQALKNGLTHPEAIAKLVSRGVHVYSHRNLHAKIFALGPVAIVGSANASNSAANRLVEAITYTSDPDLVRNARRFIMSALREAVPVDSTYLLEAKKAYRRPRGGEGSESVHTADKAGIRLHVVDFPGSEPPKLVEKHHRANLADWQAKVGPPTRWSADFSWDDCRAWLRHDDWVLWVYVGGDSPEVLPPMQFLDRVPAGGRSAQKINWFRAPNKRQLSWGYVYSRVLAKANFRLECGRVVRSDAAVNAVFALWNLQPLE